MAEVRIVAPVKHQIVYLTDAIASELLRTSPAPPRSCTPQHQLSTLSAESAPVVRVVVRVAPRDAERWQALVPRRHRKSTLRRQSSSKKRSTVQSVARAVVQAWPQGLRDWRRIGQYPGKGANASVDTLRLRAIQRPSGVERLLDALVRKSEILPSQDWHSIRNPDALSPELQQLSREASSAGRAWRCWTDGHRTLLLTAEVIKSLSKQKRLPVLQVTVYDGGGALRDCGLWACDWDGRWRNAAQE